MTKSQMEKMILIETKDLPMDILKEILECIRIIKQGKHHFLQKNTNSNIEYELNELSEVSRQHLEEEFYNYKELYPRE